MLIIAIFSRKTQILSPAPARHDAPSPTSYQGRQTTASPLGRQHHAEPFRSADKARNEQQKRLRMNKNRAIKRNFRTRSQSKNAKTGKKVACPSSRGHAQKIGKQLTIGTIDKRLINERLVIGRGVARTEK
ncbi:hypothetical protein [Aeromonas allosaccharophila]|uniref:hypothetical protein n=1 Tax=Aeromonas allosaccharophila TaxID=656 RepID=UPI0034333F9E